MEISSAGCVVNPDAAALRWLMTAGDASVRYFTLIELLDRPVDAPDVRAERARIGRSARVRALLSGQWVDGGFAVHPYQKWTGAHWRLVSLAELGLPPGNRHAIAAADQVLRWLTGQAHRRQIVAINGLTRRCASQEGNAVAACCRLGLAEDPRVRELAEALLGWQWPDGGWNCDRAERARHSSFHESLAPLWGLIEYQRATGETAARPAAERTAELLLRHRLFRSERTGAVIDADWLRLHYPAYWHYDILQALVILARLGPLRDPRLQEALDLIAAKRRPDGTWEPDGCYWRPPPPASPSRGAARLATRAGRRPAAGQEVVDWGRRGASTMLTLNALRVLKAAGRFCPEA